jgi:putative transposase
VICTVLGVSRSGYYDWLHRVENPSERGTARTELIDRIRKHRYYGSPRIHRELVAAKVQVGRHTVARLMRANGISARRGKIKSRPRTAPPARRPEVKDLVKRDFHADVANALWFTDLTQIRTLEGWVFAAVILDAFNREVVSYAVDAHQTPRTAMRALTEALQIRRPPSGCIVHSDRGYQFTSRDWLDMAAASGMQVSIGERKSAYDNATMESWFASYKNEDLYPNGQPATRNEARSRLFAYVWDYNHIRLHSSLGYVPPTVYAAESSICP